MLTIKTPERRHCRRSGAFIVKLEHISHLTLVFLLLTLSRCLFAGSGINSYKNVNAVLFNFMKKMRFVHSYIKCIMTVLSLLLMDGLMRYAVFVCVCFFACKTAALLYRKEKHFDLAGK